MLDLVEIAVFVGASRRRGDETGQASRSDDRARYLFRFAHRWVPLSPEVYGRRATL